ncbi:mRNA interferase MazF [Austwickia chelonae]|uniref:Uncharacterized protein n=1 Tax=Austwickia chelonae NBRC 105200 TaxID=1184607 RepID=K6VV36_9MICO|nr:type II toxin-antitoxin system PemK/MazF family toxin [Austwickia chelonae]GAB79200.1 hypothetical protein AUCHE_21_00250 [Austwickia chelonae NBRC 105200]SEW37158.1 mRNA interferase MazF [Austwickia chelonae]
MKTPWPLHRGQIYLAKLGGLDPKYYLVVSNNRRNRNLDSVLAVRMTSSPKPPLPTIVSIKGRASGLEGVFVCDDIVEIYEDEVLKDSGAVSPDLMRDVEAGLKAALALP